ncbi:MAG: glycosyltransferase family 2 protein [Gammaproteobacteria bacterium]|nr:glycosyltransferase family 2 protein [Gammaproteobacteria bacterium]
MTAACDPDVPERSLRERLELALLHVAAGGLVPARWFLPQVPDVEARTGRLSLEIVSHCWNYAHLLAFQLSSLVLYPPQQLGVTMTVFHAAEDEDTVALLAYFGAQPVPGVTWNWQVLRRGWLFRRAIGRNLAARATRCDWIWFTDCDVVFHAGCLDGLALALQGRRDALVFPRVEHCSELLPPGDPLLEATRGAPRVTALDLTRFSPRQRGRATGPLQITHGDVARACGYCAGLAAYQRPSRYWPKLREDRAFRWLLRTAGSPIEVPGVYRIQHLRKGRYRGSLATRLRTAIRRARSRLRERGAAVDTPPPSR